MRFLRARARKRGKSERAQQLNSQPHPFPPIRPKPKVTRRYKTEQSLPTCIHIILYTYTYMHRRTRRSRRRRGRQSTPTINEHTHRRSRARGYTQLYCRALSYVHIKHVLNTYILNICAKSTWSGVMDVREELFSWFRCLFKKTNGNTSLLGVATATTENGWSFGCNASAVTV